MTVQLNREAFHAAMLLIADGLFIVDAPRFYSVHQPSDAHEDALIEEQGWVEYARWHLGVDEDAAEETKARYSFPIGDFARVHRCAALEAEAQAAHDKRFDIERAAAELRTEIDERAGVGDLGLPIPG